ncbi:MAG TPA: adenosylcobinamide-phosphate synthase CbiB [Bacillota bacterium]|nr:adenosylcobinamide-phosphate synthase CbiB [Bacillota bacterium]
MLSNIYLAVSAYLLDLMVGDPPAIPHPVVMIGKTIDWLEKWLRSKVAPGVGLLFAGGLLTVITVGTAYTVTWLAVMLLGRLAPWLGYAAGIWLISTTISTTSLYRAAKELFELLEAGNLEQARVKVGWIVGRDTQALDEGEITRATVETVAENIVDGIVAPLFYAVLGGAPLAMAYRAINTLDSMVGYRNERYQYFGRFSARLDDVANYIPARITGLLLLVAAAIKGLNWKAGLAAIRRDAPRHPSPNSGFPESAVAGSLGVQLGGLNYYGGIASHRALMGDKNRELNREDIRQAWQLMYLTTMLFCALGLGTALALQL